MPNPDTAAVPLSSTSTASGRRSPCTTGSGRPCAWAIPAQTSAAMRAAMSAGRRPASRISRRVSASRQMVTAARSSPTASMPTGARMFG